MGGRCLRRRRGATALPALLLVLLLLVLPSMGSRLVATAPLSAVAPSTAVVHVLGDEVVAVPPGAVHEMRTRLLAPDDVLLAVVLATFAALAALGASVHRLHGGALGRSLVPVPATPGRSPPPRVRTR